MSEKEMIQLVEHGLAEWVDSKKDAVRLRYNGAIVRTKKAETSDE